MTTIASLKDRYTEVRERVARAAERSERTESDVLVIAVCKYAEPDAIRELIQLGHLDFGENKVQQLVQRAAMMDEWLARRRSMPGLGADAGGGPAGAGELPERVRWHMIGHLQRNKVRKVVETARLIHGVDSLRVAEETQAIAAKKDIEVDVLLQVNIAGESQKYGCAIPAAYHLAEQIDTMVQVRVRGIMAMAPISDDPEASRSTFSRARELFTEIQESGVGAPHFNILSMGMSNDFEVAIEEGANMVRVGSAIFGEPAASDDDGSDDE